MEAQEGRHSHPQPLVRKAGGPACPGPPRVGWGGHASDSPGSRRGAAGVKNSALVHLPCGWGIHGLWEIQKTGTAARWKAGASPRLPRRSDAPTRDPQVLECHLPGSFYSHGPRLPAAPGPTQYPESQPPGPGPTPTLRLAYSPCSLPLLLRDPQPRRTIRSRV